MSTNEGGEVVPFGRERRSYEDALVEQLTARAIADANRRLQAILYCDAAKGRRSLAMHLAFATDMQPEQAVAVLNASGIEHEPVRDDAPSPDFASLVARARGRR
jgi:hypothetical protein